MALSRWEPSEGLTALRREMDHLLEDFFGKSPFHLGDAGAFSPSVEVADTKDAVVVKAQVPGVTQEQLQVNITNDAVTLKGDMKEEEKKEEKNYYRREFRYGSFTRTIPLPVAVQSEKATAKLKDGVLEISIPKSKQAKVKTIPIQT
jgi:HSP20 family protein